MFKKRAVFNQLTVLIKSTHLLSGKISSSRETHSSSTLLLSTRDDTKAKKRGKVTLIFLWNLSKAFIPRNTEPSYKKWANLDFPNHSLKQHNNLHVKENLLCRKITKDKSHQKLTLESLSELYNVSSDFQHSWSQPANWDQ